MNQYYRNYEEESFLFQGIIPFNSEDDYLNSEYPHEKEHFSLNNSHTFFFSSQQEDLNEFQYKNIDNNGNENTIQSIIQIMNKTNEDNAGEISFHNDNPFNALNIPTLPKIDEKEQIQREKQNEMENNISDNAYNKTKFTSKEENKRNDLVLIPFQTKKPQKRIDYSLKYFKTHFSNFLKNYGNNLIKKSLLPKNLKKLQLSSPNHISFTGNPTDRDNYKFLFFTVEQIFCYFKNENCQVSRQKKNKIIIEQILQFIEANGGDGKYDDVKSFFKMRLEDAYTLFYNQPEYFKKYAADSKTIDLDKEFQAEKGFSLLEPNGFIKVFKMLRKKE